MPEIDHVVVLALENRSFDHMLGFLDHPDPAYGGLREGRHTNPGWPGTPEVAAEPTAKRVLPLDPDHSHDAVMEQLSVRDRTAHNQGFVTSYERKGRGLATPSFGGLLGPLINWWIGRSASKATATGRGPLIMLCQPQEQVPVLSSLALEFGVCTRWFCSVPGETWPNRNFMHAATSDGTTNIDIRPYSDPTIFEQLEEHDRTWHVYYDDLPQVMAFTNLWSTPERHANWFPLADFVRHAETGRLPAYSFLEPNHRPPVHTLDHAPVIGTPGVSNSQHPGNNIVTDYDSYEGGTSTDFARAETLIATVYEALRSNRDLFERSLLLITYDEHGGFYDHVPPPTGVPAPGDPRGRLARLLNLIWNRRSAAFDFTMLGPRVPAVVVSPYVPKGTVDATPREHASVPATLRAIFAPGAKPLTRRDAAAEPFHTSLTRTEPRRDDLPDLSSYAAAPETLAAPEPEPAPLTGHYKEFVAQAELVRKKLAEVAEPEVADLPAEASDTRWATEMGEAFANAARRHRRSEANRPG